jgi:hypothetical protein
MNALDLDRFAQTPLERHPFDYLVIPKFIRPETLPTINADYPPIDRPGSFPPVRSAAGPGLPRRCRAQRGGGSWADPHAHMHDFGIDQCAHALLRGQSTAALDSTPFADLSVLPFAGANNAGFTDSPSNSFYRIRAFHPLTP